MNKTLIILAANVGIDARKMTVEQLKAAYAASRVGAMFADQHDMRLQEALRRAK